MAMPADDDIRAVTVPGCVDGWLTLHARFGRLPIAEVLDAGPGLRHRRVPRQSRCSHSWCRSSPTSRAPTTTRPPRSTAGTVLTRPGVARTLAAIVEGGREAFYEGEFGAGLRRLGDGLFSEADLDRCQADWVDALGIDVWDHLVWTVPPASQGYLSLSAAGIAERIGLGAGLELASEDRRMGPPPGRVGEAGRPRPSRRRSTTPPTGRRSLRDERLRLRAAAFRDDRPDRLTAPAGAGDTIYLCAVDGDGMAVSLIQSNARGWGVHLAVPEVGIFLHNRGQGFSLDGRAPGRVPARTPPAPHARPGAGAATRRLAAQPSLGTMGGDTQPQVVLQLLARLLLGRPVAGRDASAHPGGASATAASTPGRPAGPVTSASRPTPPPPGPTASRARGHDVRVEPAWNSGYGHAHLIERDAATASLAGAHDPRALTGATATW